MPNKLTNEYLNILSLSSSLILLVLSQIENTKEFKLKAFKMHQNAMQLSELYSKVIIINDEKSYITKENVQKLHEEYHTILRNCEDNHNNYDYQLFRSMHWNDEDVKISKKYGIFLKIWVHFKLYIYYLLLISTPPALLLLLLIF